MKYEKTDTENKPGPQPGERLDKLYYDVVKKGIGFFSHLRDNLEKLKNDPS